MEAAWAYFERFPEEIETDVRDNEAARATMTFAQRVAGMSEKSVLEAALNLPLKSKRVVARKLLEHIDDQELQKTILEGARIAEVRLKKLRLGKSRKVSAEEVEAMLARRTKR